MSLINYEMKFSVSLRHSLELDSVSIFSGLVPRYSVIPFNDCLKKFSYFAKTKYFANIGHSNIV